MEIVFFFKHFFIACMLIYVDLQETNDENKCISQWQQAGLGKRFSTDQLKWMCKQRIHNRQVPLMDSVRMTDRQLAYLDFVQHCKNNECRHQFASDEEEANTQADPNSDPRCKLSKKSWRPKFCDTSKHPACQRSNKPKFCDNSNLQRNPKNRGKRSFEELLLNYRYSDSKIWLNQKQMDLKRSKRQSPNEPAIRKDYRLLTDQQRDVVHYAMNKLKKAAIDRTNKWDLFTAYHYPQQSPAAHWGPGFLPWHREFLRQFEVALRSESPDFIGLPYWDSTLDYSLPDARDSIIWTSAFMGNGNGLVKEGAFNSWPTLTALDNEPNINNLYRDVGGSPFGGLIRHDDLKWILNRTHFGQLSACVDPTFELLHGLPHIFVGGFMQIIRISPNDPIFYFHHTYVDYLWEQFRQQRQTPQQRLNDWAPADKLCDDSHKIDASMAPFPGLKNRDGLSEEYTRKWYHFDSPPTCSNANPDCGSPYLWCDSRDFQCKSKIRKSGNCTGFDSTNICWNSICSHGLCQAADTPLDTTQHPIVTPIRPEEITPQIVHIITQPPETNPPVRPTEIPAQTQATEMIRISSPGYFTTMPPGSYNTKVSQGSTTYPTVFFKTFMVDENGAMTKGTVQVEGISYQGTTSSNPITVAKYPEHPGIVYAQVKNPNLAFVQAKVSAFDDQGRPCRAYCAQGYYKDVYVPCGGQLTLSSDPEHSTPIPFTDKENVKRFLNADMSQKPSAWKVRAPYLSFLCGSETNSKKFQELADYVKPPVNTSDHLWFHVLVLDGRVPYHRSLPGSSVQSKTVDYQGGTYQAEVPKDITFPHYYGVAPVKAQNPSMSRTVKVDIKAFDPQGKQCVPTCERDGKSYLKCQGIVTLSMDPAVPDIFPFTSDDDLKDFLSWDMTQHPNAWRRMVSSLQFVC